ncbi:MAG TPA: ATP-binding cassette domain-containing protein [Candidatus Ornithoclostridium faecavium]|nr:ATP-binding cassette domain-containing protein [Candidatus Ornithoclostridium faecavium]
MLKLEGITKDYKSGDGVVHALKGINLEFRRTEFVSILGHSGCGKTTMLNIIGGLDRYTDGDMSIDGVSTKKYKDVDWDTYRNIRIGFVFQSYNLIQHLTILDNVAMAMTLSGVGLAERKRRAEEALRIVGLEGQMKKLPNQLSGGQMQRVSIARAIVNNPEIILADEPTGALDSATSVQIMELLKEISRTKLVIMVTHNRELAEQYSTRIVSVKDGEIVGDTMPYDGSDESSTEKKVEFEVTDKEKKKKLKKSSMSYSTAIKLSFKNLMTKKGRTLMTSIAGSIGIIGVCLVLAISNGFSNYVNELQQTVLAGYPVQIAQETFDTNVLLNMFMGGTSGSDGRTQYPDKDTVIQYNPSEMISSAVIENDFGQDYIDYVNKVKENGWASSVTYSYGMDMTVIGKTVNVLGTENYEKVNPSGGFDMSGLIVPKADIGWSEMIGDEEFIMSQYDLVAGTFPQNKNQVILVVDSYNQANVSVLLGLGFRSSQKEVSFDDIVGTKLRVVANDDLYVEGENGFFAEKTDNAALKELYLAPESETNLEIEVVGVLRPKEGTQLALLSTGINYTSELTQYLLDVNSKSRIVEAQSANTSTDVTTGMPFTEKDTYRKAMQKIGGDSTPTGMNIYPKDFSGKEKIIAYLDQWNADNPDSEVVYVDMSEMAAGMLNEIIRIISIVLVCFAAISLVVSSVMIGIITYVSVVERTKEIGILRSLGARKIDISNVFNAETFIIGLLAGVIGVIVTYILSIPINLIIYNLVEISTLCMLSPWHALIMIVVSFVLTLVAGLVPSSVAAKKDPVEALRTE